MKESNTEYIKVFMEYESDDMPVVFFYEVDLYDERFGIRVIEVFADRQVKIMDDIYRDVIEIMPIPTVDELNSKVWGDGFYAMIISKEEFEEIWNSQTYSGNLSVEI